jgi:hypothetical protein
MPRDIPIGNGSLLILYDKKGLLRDLYFQSVDSENHARDRSTSFNLKSLITSALEKYHLVAVIRIPCPSYMTLKRKSARLAPVSV